MKVPWSWLNEYVKIDVSQEEVMRRLTAVGHMQDGPAKDVAGDLVYDLEVRQNRSDCLSLVGVAREVAAVLKVPLKNPLQKTPSVDAPAGEYSVSIQNEALCYRFQTVRLSVQVGPSPDWLKNRLEAYGMKSINNVIDITNYVMIELGMPMHAFDADQLKNHNLTIRLAKPGESLTVLGGRNISFQADDLIIADDQGVVTIAGIIGGENSGVSAQTTQIILEAATYNQASIRRTALRHTLRTEASTRLEKFLHPEGTDLALNRAIELLISLAQAKVLDGVDAYPRPISEKTISLRAAAVERLGGVSLRAEEMQALLAQEEISSTIEEEETLRVTIPYWRTDLEQEADLVEEVLRLYGYDNIPERLPSGFIPKNIQSPFHDLEEKLRDLFVACGFDEQITEPLVNEPAPTTEPVRLQNSLSSEKVMLRTTLRHQLLAGKENRLRYRQTQIQLFEVGKTYAMNENVPTEKKIVAALMSGPQASYAKMKGVAELILGRLGVLYQEDLAQITHIDEQTVMLELDLAKILNAPRQNGVKILTAPPQILLEDWSLLVPQETRVGELIAIAKAASPIIKQIELGEEPRQKENGQKSLFLRVTFHDPTRTLTSDDVAQTRTEVVKMLADRFSAQLR